MFFIGIDLADKSFDFCIVNLYGDVVSRGREEMSDEGFSSFIQTLNRKGIDASSCIISLENPRSRFAEFLCLRGNQLYAPNPKAIARYRESRFNTNAKSDSADAQLIADHIREHYRSLKPIKLPPQQIRHLQMLLEDRDKLVKDKTRLSNRLTSILKEYFPQAFAAFSDITSKTALLFLERVDSFQEAKGISRQQWQEMLNESHFYNPKARERFFQAMQQKEIFISPAVISAKAMMKRAILAQLKVVIHCIYLYDQKIRELFDQIPHSDIFRSLPGVDYLLGAKLLVLFSKEFRSAKEVQSYCGTSPYSKLSGQSRGVYFRSGCNKFGRNLFVQIAFCSLTSSAFAKSYYRKKRLEGKSFHHALRCLANVWAKIAFAIWRDKSRYDESKHLAAIALHSLSAD